MKFIFLFLSLLFISSKFWCQYKIDKTNLTKTQYEFWDKNKSQIKAYGSFYKDKINRTTKKHGLWRFYSKRGVLEEEINYYTDSIHGRHLIFWDGKKIKQESYYYMGIPDSVMKQWNESGTLILDGFFDYGLKADIWYSYYDNGKPKSEVKYLAGVEIIDNFWLNDSNHTQTIINGYGKTVNHFNSGKIKEIFQVERGLRNGPYKEFSARGSLLIDGYFKNGFKDSCWITYYYNELIEKTACYKQDTLVGEYYNYYLDGKTKTHGFFDNGKKSGNWKWFTEDGIIDSEGHFLNDLQEGEWKYYFKSGDISYIANFKDGKKSGEWNYFYSKQKPYKRGNYINDKKEGLWKTWYETGVLLMEGNYKEDKETGEWKNHWENGKIKNIAFFQNGKLHGEWKSYSPYGKLKVEGKYDNDLQTGKWTEWYENNRLKEVINYKIIRKKSKANDVVLKGRIHRISVKHGEFVTFSNKDFQITEIGKYKRGEKDGVWQAYHPGGRIIAVENEYKNGKLHGTSRQFDRKGKIIQLSTYKNGLLHGPMKFYNEKGKITKEFNFKYGQKVSNQLQFRP